MKNYHQSVVNHIRSLINEFINEFINIYVSLLINFQKFRIHVNT
jgi:hypothetical protein